MTKPYVHQEWPKWCAGPNGEKRVYPGPEAVPAGWSYDTREGGRMTVPAIVRQFAVTDGFSPPATAAHDPDPDSVAIPADWRELPWPKLRALAAKVSPGPVTDKPDCIAAIEAEMARRGA